MVGNIKLKIVMIGGGGGDVGRVFQWYVKGWQPGWCLRSALIWNGKKVEEECRGRHTRTQYGIQEAVLCKMKMVNVELVRRAGEARR